MTTDIAVPTITHTIVGTGPYSVPWPYGEGELVVRAELDGVITTLANPAAWTPTPISATASGIITLASGTATDLAGGRLVIERATVQEQGWQGLSGREIGLTATLDRMTRALQDLEARSGGMLRLLGSTSLQPIANPVSGATLIWDGTGFMPGPTANQIVAAQGYAVAAGDFAGAAQEILDRIDLGALDEAVTATGLDAAATATDRAQTALDRAATGEDVSAAALYLAQTEIVRDATSLIGIAQKAFTAPLIFDAILQGLIGDDAVAVGATYTATGADVDYIGIYRRTGDAAVEVDRLPVSRFVYALEQVQSLMTAHPNLVSPRTDRIESAADFATTGTSTLAAHIVAGLPVWRLTVPGSNAALYRVPRALISGSVVSASVLIAAMSAAGAGATSTNARVLLRQLNSSVAEIADTRQTYNLVTPSSDALVVPDRVRFAAVPFHADCALVELWIEASNTGGATARTIDFREIHISGGPSAIYRVPGQAFAVDAETEIRARADWAWTQNDWPDSELEQVGAAVNWGIYPLEIVTVHGRRAMLSPPSAVAVSVPAPAVDVSGYASGKISVSFVVEEKPAIAEGALRLRLVARDASNAILPWTDQRGTDFVTEPNAYTRFVPAEAVDASTTIVVARDIAVPAGTVTVTPDMRVETTERMAFNKICVREGGDPSYKPSPTQAGATEIPNSVSIAVEQYLPGAFSAQDGTRTISVIEVDGQKKHRITNAPGSTALSWMQMPRGNILGLDTGKLSFSARVAASAGDGTTGSSRVLLLFRNGSSELAAFRQTQLFNSTGAAVLEQLVNFADVTIPTDDWDNVRVIWDAQPGNGTIARTMDVHDVLLTGGPSSAYRRRGPGSLGSIPVTRGFAVLPDLPGGPASGGFTCTGLDKIRTGAFSGCWLIASDGRAVEGDGSPHAARAVITTPDFTRLLASYDLASPTADGVQGIAWDSSDGTFWAARPGLKRIEHYTGAGVEIVADRIALAGWAGAWDTPNGLAYDAANNALYVCSASSATVYRITKAGAIAATRTIGSATPDQLCLYDGKLYISVGANGSNGEVHAHDLTTGVNSVPFVQIPFAQAIEGIWRDAVTLSIVNDGGFHTVAAPALNFGANYEIG